MPLTQLIIGRLSLGLLLLSSHLVMSQDEAYNSGLSVVIEYGQLNGIGNVNYEQFSFDYSASTGSLSLTTIYALNSRNSLGVGALVTAFSPFSNDNLVMPFFADYAYYFKSEPSSVYASVRLGHSFKFGTASEVEDGLFVNLRLGYRKLPVFNSLFISPFVGFVLQQVRDDTVTVFDPLQGQQVISDDVTFKALQAGLQFYLVK